METTPKKEMKNFLADYIFLEREGVYFLESRANKLSSLMEKYKQINIPIIHHVLQPKLDDLISEEIDRAINAKGKNKREKLIIARNKYLRIESDFFTLFN